ncbi:MAG: hypothetical protein P4L35_06730 [Ignavibacteriaceae bacterium]|nr:hypothetical protein [Ignavibacteriaceae bacterium]
MDKKREDRIKKLIEMALPYFEKLWSKRKSILIFNGTVLALVLLFLIFISKPYFESTVSILPEYGSKSNMLSQFNNLASLVGVKVGEVSATEIYQNLVNSESVFQPVIYHKYLTNEYPDSINLIDYFQITAVDKNPENQARLRFLKLKELMLKSLVITDIDRVNKVLSIKVTMPEAQLSADVANNILESLDSYIRTKRKSYAIDQRIYIQKRLSEVKDSLNLTENKLKDFREKNRMILQSPELLLEQGRMMRDVEIMQGIFVELSKQLELAKIDEIKDTPILNIKESALSPVQKTGPHRLVIFIAAFFITFFFSLVLFLINDDIKRIFKFIRMKNGSTPTPIIK